MTSEIMDVGQIVTEDGQTVTILYNLVTIQMMDEAGKKKNAYGIEIVKKRGSEVLERDFVYALSQCKKIVMEMLHKLSKNTVTPVCLAEILDDLAV